MREYSVNNALIDALLNRVGDLEQEVARLKSENERLTVELAAAKKNSHNSSKYPESDMVKLLTLQTTGQNKPSVT